ncbi:MAG: hypothetical protein ABIG30_00060 [Candidatus Aenigmatarchaeota archaeon]
MVNNKNQKFDIKRMSVLFLICLLASLTLSTFVHELVHVTQLSLSDNARPTSICWDFGQESVAHTGYVVNNADVDKVQQDNEGREFVAYTMGLGSLAMFMTVLKVEHYW